MRKTIEFYKGQQQERIELSPREQAEMDGFKERFIGLSEGALMDEKDKLLMQIKMIEEVLEKKKTKKSP